MRNYARRLRSELNSRCIVGDHGDIPRTLRVVRPLHCAVAHPGLCPTASPALHKRGIALARRLIEHVRTVGDVGSVFELEVQPSALRARYLIGYIRHAGPREVVALLLTDAGHGKLRVCCESPGGRVRAMTSTEIAAEVLHDDGLASVIARKLVVCPVPDSIADVYVEAVPAHGETLFSVEEPLGVRQPRAAVVADDSGGNGIAAGFALLPAAKATSARPRQPPPKAAREAVPKAVAVVKRAEISVGEDSDSSASSGLSSDSSAVSKAKAVAPRSSKQPSKLVEQRGLAQRLAPEAGAPSTEVAAVVDDDSGVEDVPFERLVKSFAHPADSGAASSSSAPGGDAALAAKAAPKSRRAAASSSSAARARAGERATPWGPYKLAEVWCGGSQIGWGTVCLRHPDCKKQVTYGRDFDDAACVLQLKRWLHEGVSMEEGAVARVKHVRVNARALRGLEEPALDAWAEALPSA